MYREAKGLLYGPQAILLAVLTLLGAVSHAAEITISMSEPSSERRELSLIGRRIDGTADPIERSVPAPGTSELPLPPGLWEIRVADADVWAPITHIRNGDSTTIRVWPTTWISGTSNGATRLRVRFTATAPNGPSSELDCETAAKSWRCTVPTGQYDLRFSSPASAPEFLFGVSIVRGAEPREIPIHFVAGASLSGRVQGTHGVPSMHCTVTLISQSGPDPGRHAMVQLDGRGFFQFRGVASGDYFVSAGTESLMSEKQPVHMIAGVSAELNAPLVLHKPTRLTITVMPPLDPGGSPWKVRLTASGTASNAAEFHAESKVSATGEWTRSKLVAGDYQLQIRQASGGVRGEGALWKSEDLRIESEDVTIAIIALPVTVDGLVTLGGRPIEAKLSFGGEGGPMLSSDDDGRFTGPIPPGERERRILVEAKTPQVTRTVWSKIEPGTDGHAYLRVDLPATSLTGRVVNVDQSPVHDAILTVTRDDPDVFEQTSSESDGTFSIAGFEPGRYTVTADAFQRISSPVSVELSDGGSTQVELVLRPTLRLRGRMTVGDSPVVAAQIHVLPRGTQRPVVPRATTNEDGFFEVEVPPGTSEYDGIAVHSLFDVVMGRGTLREGKHAVVRTRRVGGTLIVEAKDTRDLRLQHNGADIPLLTVAYLGGGVVEKDQTTLFRLEPGPYAICFSDQKSCVSGYLAPYGTLTLTPAP